MSPLHFAHISKDVAKKLDAILSGWRELVSAQESTKISESDLISLLKDKRRAKIYREVADKRNSLFGEFLKDASKPVSSLVQEFNKFLIAKADELFGIEESLSKLSAYIKDKKAGKKTSKISVTQKVKNFYNDLESHCDDYLNYCNGQVNLAFDGINYYVGSFGTNALSRISKNLSDFKNQLKAENKRFIDDQKSFFRDTLKGIVDKKADSSGRISSRAEFTQDESKIILEKAKDFTMQAINNQKSLRSEVIKKVVATTLDEANSNNYANVIREKAKSVGLDKKHIDFLEKLINVEFVNIPNVTDLYLGASYTWSEDAREEFESYLFDELKSELKRMIDQKEEEESEIVNNPVYRWCNRGFSPVLKHIFTWGFCTGATIAGNIDALIRGQRADLQGLMAIVGSVQFLFSLRFGFSGAFLFVLKEVICYLPIPEKDTLCEILGGKNSFSKLKVDALFKQFQKAIKLKKIIPREISALLKKIKKS